MFDYSFLGCFIYGYNFDLHFVNFDLFEIFSLRSMCGHFEFFFRLVRKIHYTPKSVYTQHFGYFIFKILNHAQIRIARPWYEIIKK